MKNKKTWIALTWGWTWGHIFPLLSIYNFLKEKENLNFFWVWQEKWLEYDIAIENDIPFFDIPSWKLRRYFDIRNFFEPLKNITWIFFGIYFLIRYKIDIVFSKWWYVAVPLCIAAFILRKKIYIHESDTVPGLANKIIWKIATKVFYTFPNEKTEKNFKKHIFIWQILNPEILEWLENTKLDENMYLNVIVIAWSQGSSRIFESILKILPKLSFIDFTIILWEKNISFRKDFVKYDNVRCFDFISQKDLGKILKQTDIAITRWWATTLWELTMFWIHSLIVPLKESAWNHQQKNAEFFQEKYWSEILEESEELANNIFKKLEKYKNLRKSGLNLKDFLKPLEFIENEITGKNKDFLNNLEKVKESSKKNYEKKQEEIIPENNFETKNISDIKNMNNKQIIEDKTGFKIFSIK